MLDNISSKERLNQQIKGFYNTQSLFEDTFYDLDIFELESIDIDSFDSNSIDIKIQLPLGKRVEIFFESLIDNSLRYNVISRNIQIINNKNTLGELDFIIYDLKEKTYTHIELVYKFYVYDDRFHRELDRYIGPNRSDTLVLKLNKLKNKQFPLLFKEQTKEYIKDIDLDNINQKVCYKANIFLPLHLVGKTLPLINNATIIGFYLSFEKFLEQIEFKNYEFFLPHRYDWLTNPRTNSIWKNYNEIEEEIEFFIKLKASPLVWLKKEQKGEVIFERFFITWW